MAAVELTEEECYLIAILTDPSGLDQAEFLWIDEENEDSCWRAWAFQWAWWRCMDSQQIDRSGRSIGKSTSIKIRACAFPFVHPGQEMLITAPEGNHLDAITDLIETQLYSTRLYREMLTTGRGGIKHRPFHVTFANNSRIMGRIPQRTGKGVKGQHPLWLEQDEAQDYPDNGWTEIIETLKLGSHGAVWRAHGVTRGVRDKFFEYTQPDSGWTVHRLTALHRPTWSNEEREKKIRDYGSKDHPDYRRNVLGLHGDSTNPLFVQHRLGKCIVSASEHPYNTDEFCYIKINNEMVVDQGDEIIPLLDFPRTHQNYKRTWIGMDVGYTNHPSEILVFAETLDRASDYMQEAQTGKKVKYDPKDRMPGLKLIARVKLERISHGHQVDAILYMINYFQPQGFAMDKTGLGLPLFQDIQERAVKDKRYKIVVDTIKGYNFSSKILVDFDTSVELDVNDDVADKAGIEKNVLEFSSDKLRQLVDNERFMLPIIDPGGIEVVREFQGITWTYDKSTMDMYGRTKSYSKGNFHALDAARMAALGFAQYGIEKITKKAPSEETPVILL
jgi:hypothetical protein